jgi:hypothetical protein
MLGSLLQDVRYALHGFASRPMFAAVVVLTLAVGIGVNVAVFSLFDQIVLRELPVARPNELVKLVSPGPRFGMQFGGLQGGQDENFSYPLFRDLEAAGESYVDLAASWIAQVSLSNGDRTVRDSAVLVSGDYFAALGVGPELGRVLGPQDVVVTEPAANVVLSFDYWTTAFAADPKVLGKKLVVSGQPLEIVGVAPRGFVGTTPGRNIRVFAPLTHSAVCGPECRSMRRKGASMRRFARSTTTSNCRRQPGERSRASSTSSVLGPSRSRRARTARAMRRKSRERRSRYSSPPRQQSC